MITEKLLFALQFKKLENLELKIDYENEKETEDLIIRGPAYYYRIDEDLYVTIFIRENDVVALLGSHTDSIPETEAFKIKSPSEIFDIMSTYFGLRVNWVDSFANKDIESELNAPNLFDTHFYNKESWKVFTRGLVMGYSISVDLLRGKFKPDFDFDNTFDTVTGRSMKDALCMMILDRAKVGPQRVIDLMNWLESRNVYQAIQNEKEYLRGIVEVVEQSKFINNNS